MTALIYSGSCKGHHSPRHTYIADRIRFFDRYSNTLLVSLNNRIAIRDTYEARGAVVDHNAATRLGFTAYPGTTTDTIILEPEKRTTNLMKELPPLPGAEAAEKVNSKS